MNVTAADQFISWFKINSERLSSLYSQVKDLKVDGDVESLREIFKTLSSEIDPKLEEVESGLQFELSKGEEAGQKHNFILSPGGISSLVPIVKYITEQLSDNNFWNFIPFKPARELKSDSKQILYLNQAPLEVTPNDIVFTLKPEINKISITLYFDSFTVEDYTAWATIGFNFLDFLLGEYLVMKTFGDIVFTNTSELKDQLEGEVYPLLELSKKVNEIISKVRGNYDALTNLEVESRVKKNLEIISSNVSFLDGKIKAIKADSNEDNLVYLNIKFWTSDLAAADILVEMLPEFEVSVEFKDSIIGEGNEINLSGSFIISESSPLDWIKDILVKLDRQVFLIGVYEQSSPDPFYTQFAAMNYIQQDDFDSAIDILEEALAKGGEFEDGSLYCLLSYSYLRCDKYEEALEYCNQALEMDFFPEIIGEILTNKGTALQRLDKFEEAFECFQEALTLDRENHIYLYNLGQAYARRNDDDMNDISTACELISKALTKDPSLKELLFEDIDLDGIRNTPEFKELLEIHGSYVQ